METCHQIIALRKQIEEYKRQGKRIAFVPTMGNLHAGHMELIRTAHQHGDIVVASVFVNPLQFGASEDFDSYPKTLEQDQQQLADNGCHLLFAPSTNEMYPDGQLETLVSVPNLSDKHCGASRPGHFQGVATVVTKLFAIVQPDAAIFGEKDFQQLAVIRQLTKDLSLPVEIVGVATARNQQGLALSSRNGYLSEQELLIAPSLYQILQRTKKAILAGNNDNAALETSAEQFLQTRGFIPDYFHICQQSTLNPASPDDSEIVILAAAKLGKARLIDNITFHKDR